MDISEFLSVYFSDVVGWMSGLFSVALAIYGFLKPNLSDQKRGFIVSVAVVCILIAPIHIWTVEHRARIEAEKKSDERRPNLKLSIVEIATGMVNDKTVAMLVTVRIRNVGTPSIADSWEIVLDSPEGKGVSFDKRIIPINGINIGIKNISASDNIFDKVVSNPIVEGGQQVGVIFYYVNGISIDKLNDQYDRIKLSVQDVTGRQVISSPFKGSPIGPMYYPGMKHP